MLSEKIQKAINENMPQMVGEELKQMIEGYHKLQQNNEDLKNKIESLEENNKSLIKELKNAQRSLIKYQELEQQKEDIEERERNLKVTTAMLERDAEKDKCKTILALVNKVFGHPNVTIERREYGNIPMGLKNDGYTSSGYKDITKTETTTQGKT